MSLGRHTAFVDGSVQFVGDTIEIKTLLRAITREGNEMS